MVSRIARRKRKDARKYAERLFEKHRRHNILHASPGKHRCVVILDHLKPSFNIGKIFRSSDAFGAFGIHLVGTNYFDAKAAKGSFKWVPTVFHDTFEECYRLLSKDGYRFYVLEPEASGSLHQMMFPQRSAFIFGHEEFGVSFEKEAYPDIVSLKIEQYGKVESLNVSVAASIVLYEYCRQQSSG